MEIITKNLKICLLLCALAAHLSIVYAFSFHALHRYFWLYIFLFYVFLSSFFMFRWFFFRSSKVFMIVLIIFGPYFASVLSDCFVLVFFFFDFLTHNLLNNLIAIIFMPYIALCAWFLSIAFF